MSKFKPGKIFFLFVNVVILIVGLNRTVCKFLIKV